MASSVWIDMFGPHSYDGSTTAFTGNVSVTGQFIGPAADNTAAPPFTFSGDLNTGLGSAAADTLNLITGGTSRVSVTSSAVTSGVPILAPSGDSSNPGLAFSTDPDTGFIRSGSGLIDYVSNTTPTIRFAGDTFTLRSSALIAWTDGTTGGSVDVSLSRGAANRLDLASGDSFYVVSGGLGIGTAPTTAGQIDVTGQVVGGNNIVAGAAFHFIISGASKISSPANGQFNFLNNAGSAGVGLDFATDGVLKLRDRAQTGGGALNFIEQTAPSAPDANQVVLYAVDNGGKTELLARFPSGAAQRVAIEP